MSVQFAVLASGSRGNATFVQGRNGGLLLDAGIGPKIIAERLQSVGASWARISAAILTHTHTDHVDTATFAELARREIVLYCHQAHRDPARTGIHPPAMATAAHGIDGTEDRARHAARSRASFWARSTPQDTGVLMGL